MITTLSDWFIVLAPLFQSIRSETKTNRGSHVYIFPPFGSATCNYFEFWLVYWIDSVVLITLVLVLRHSIENRSNYLSQKNNWRAHFGMFSSWTALQFTETNYLLKKKMFSQRNVSYVMEHSRSNQFRQGKQMDCTPNLFHLRSNLSKERFTTNEECCRIITGVITLSSKNKNYKEVYMLWFNFVFGWKSSFFRQISLNFENWFNFF